jgi:predicted transcriptional regulator
MKDLLQIEKLEKSSSSGPQPSFSRYEILKALEVMYRSGPVGRKRLSSILHLGEGSTRTILDHLQTAALIKTTKHGCELTDKGRRIAYKIMSRVVSEFELSENALVAGKFAYGIMVRDSASKVRNGIEQRDAAIRAGAKSATTIIYKNGKLVIPPEDRAPAKSWEDPLSMVNSKFQPQDNDVIIISGADHPFLAELGARAGLWTLLKDLS